MENSIGEVKEARKKNVILDTFTYTNHRGEEVVTGDIDGLLNLIYEFTFEKKEEEEDKKKD